MNIRFFSSNEKACILFTSVYIITDTDRDFDPSAEMMVHDYDDEHTLDEEEALSGGESVGNELDSLQKAS